MNKDQIKLAAYVYPAWHPSPYRQALGNGWTEWELVKSARPVFPGHKIIEKPLWGYYDDSDPVFVQKQIATALKYRIGIFVFSYYWDKKPVLNEGIDKGFLRAKNNQNIQFALIWSPRLPRINLPLPLNLQDNLDRSKREIGINENSVVRFIEFCKKKYFWRNNYFKIDNKPVLYFFQYYRFIEALGGNEPTKFIFNKINKILKKARFNGFYPIGTSDYLNFTQDITKTGFKALTSYNLLGNYQTGRPIQDYSRMTRKRQQEWQFFLKKAGASYFPAVSLGFDASCRGEWKLPMPKRLDGGRYYPWYPIITNSKISTFRWALKKAFMFLRENKIQPSIVHISSWNEWSEGNHLEPGMKSKFRYLEITRNIYENFKKKSC